ncbi:CRP/FNR family transcriptional regulator [Lewinella marina]|uniref:Crp/Fnr family transcriptional regulator n=1 Tax=Neolewinella marina TaxID=438751 RepID=A0A2G0CGR8_9BACT|nr:Crp/Fnr family transcriptional regulator [Neolewinella marina]NJB86414.1 CRP/FNR family transcriptional regulator [Neolewinella marina]PHK99120.1 Crp/Fnr family transcriptional regulator [Neolewinella marina]
MNDRLSSQEVRRYFPVFVEPELQEAIAELGQLHTIAAGGMLMDYGNFVRMMPLIMSGTVKVSRLGEDGSELFLYFLRPGESCVMTFTCCMADKRSQIRAVAEEDTTILALPKQTLDEWMMRYKSWKNFVMTAYDQRMNEMVQTIDQVAFHQLDERLYDYVVKRASLRPDATIQATHQEIADDLNVSREAISRLLKTLEKRGSIELGRNRIRLLDER